MMTKEKSKVLNQMMSRVRPSAIALAGGIMAITPQAAYGQVEEITVTARKREENLQEVPISVSAFTSESLRVLSSDKINNIGNYTPNVQFLYGEAGSGNAANVFIRGVGQQDILVSSDPGVGIYVDGVFLGRTLGSLLELSDVERIEVLRGPQGTLFGKNTIGGAINITTKDPGDTFEGMLKASTGRFNRAFFEGAVQLPIVEDKMSARVWGMVKQRDGYGKRLSDGGDLGDDDSASFRTKFALSPGENLKATLSFDYTRQRAESSALDLLGVNPSAGLLALYNAIVAGPQGGAYDSRYLTDSHYKTYDTNPSFNNLDVWGVHLTTSWQPEDVGFKSITAYRRMKNSFSRDGDHSPFPYLEVIRDDKQHQFSQELQVNGSGSDNRLRWTIGGYYLHEFAREDNVTLMADGLFQALESLPGQLPGLPFGGAGNPRNLAFDLSLDYLLKNTTDSYALFSEATYDVTDALSLTAGLRYSYEKKKVYLEGTRINTGRITVAPTTVSESWNDLSPRVALQYRVNEDVMVYAQFAKGFKSGGFNGRAFDARALRPYNPETVETFEVGEKADFLDNRLRLNASAFLSRYKDMQLTAITDSGGQLFTVTQNAGRAEMYGIEVEAVAVPTDGLRLFGSLGYLHQKFKELDPSVTGITIDSKLPKTPKWNMSVGAQYAMPISNFGLLTLHGDYSYRSRYFNDVANTPILVQSGYGMVNARIEFEPAETNLRISLFGTNLSDKRYLVNGAAALGSIGLADGQYGRPREWGLEVDFRF